MPSPVVSWRASAKRPPGGVATTASGRRREEGLLNENPAGVPTILYADYSPELDSDRRRLDGLRRYAASRKWRVETLEHKDCSPTSLREALSRLHPVGCAAECWCPETALPPALFRKTPVVYFSPPNRPGWRGAHGVSCDEAAVARMAFRELSSGKPSSYAVLSCWKQERWAHERIDAFRECCRAAGADCRVTCFTVQSASECPMRFRQMIPWAASLPPHCAVFAVNDCCARCAAKAMTLAGRSFPRTVTLVGADGTEPPPGDRAIAGTISTIRLDFELAGYLAAKMLGERAGIVHKSSIANCPQVANGKSDLKFGTCGQLSQMPIADNPNVSTFPPLLVDRHKSTRGFGRRDPRILEAMETIRREACDGLTAAALAARYGGSRRLFEIRFREAAGHSVLDEILNVRMARAVDMLANTNMRIDAIANFCGFNAELSFWKAFRKRMGMSPLTFRKNRQR